MVVVSCNLIWVMCLSFPHKLDCLFFIHAWLAWRFCKHYQFQIAAVSWRLQRSNKRLMWGWITYLYQTRPDQAWNLRCDYNMLLSPMQMRLGFTPKGIYNHTVFYKILGNNHVVDHLVYTLHWGFTQCFFIEVHMDVMAKSFNKGVKFRLKY